MYTLFIDTHLFDINIILLKDGKVYKKESVTDKKDNSVYLFSTIVNVIDGIKLDEIIVVNGPGSFTGVRLGVTIAKTLAYTLNIPIKTITSLKVMAISNDSKRVAINDNNGYYVGEFDEAYHETKEYEYLKEIDEDNYDLNFNIDIEKVYQHLKDEPNINPHGVNPIYIKKIGVEIDKKSTK